MFLEYDGRYGILDILVGKHDATLFLETCYCLNYWGVPQVMDLRSPPSGHGGHRVSGPIKSTAPPKAKEPRRCAFSNLGQETLEHFILQWNLTI